MRDELLEVYVQPGESRLVREPTILRTLLGSCVGVAFGFRGWVGALCHPMLPRFRSSRGGIGRSAGRRYVDFAIRDLASQFDALGARRDEVEVKLFGGGDVLADGQRCDAAHGGQTEHARSQCKVLEEEGFAVMRVFVGRQARRQHSLQYADRRSAAAAALVKQECGRAAAGEGTAERDAKESNEAG